MIPDSKIGMKTKIAFNQMRQLSNHRTWMLKVSAALDKAGLGQALDTTLDDDEKLKHLLRRAHGFNVNLI